MTVELAKPKRTRRSPDERRRQLLDAALELFASRGFDETGVGDIAARAGVAIGTVYLYFPSKEHILNELHRRAHQGMREIFLGIAADMLERTERGEHITHDEGIDLLVGELVAYVSAHRRYCEVMTRYAPRLPESASEDDIATEDLLEMFLREAMNRGAIHTSDPAMTARMIDAAVGHTMQEAAARGEDLTRLAAQAREFLTKALAP